MPWRHALPPPRTHTWHEAVRAVVGSLLGLGLTYWVCQNALGDMGDLPLLVAPMGAAAVLVFCAPTSPMAQPWPLMMGNVSAALVAITCCRLVHDPAIAAPLALSLSIAAMFLLRCLHPPGGAVALVIALGSPAIHAAGYRFVLMPIGLNALALLAASILINRAMRRPYPHRLVTATKEWQYRSPR